MHSLRYRIDMAMRNSLLSAHIRLAKEMARNGTDSAWPNRWNPIGFIGANCCHAGGGLINYILDDKYWLAYHDDDMVSKWTNKQRTSGMNNTFSHSPVAGSSENRAEYFSIQKWIFSRLFQPWNEQWSRVANILRVFFKLIYVSSARFSNKTKKSFNDFVKRIARATFWP